VNSDSFGGERVPLGETLAGVRRVKNTIIRNSLPCRSFDRAAEPARIQLLMISKK
jgi:hypothetical protein